MDAASLRYFFSTRKTDRDAAGYTAAVTKYLEDVAADSGKPTNVYSVGTQYTDSSGAHAA